MNQKIQKIILFISLLLSIQISYAIEPLPNNLIALPTNEGLKLIKNNLNLPTLKLLQNFTTQKTTTYCGIASAVTILNASNLPKPPDSTHSPYHYFTQEDFFTDNVKKIIAPEAVLKNGATLQQLGDAIKTYGLEVEVVFANKLKDLTEFRKKLQQSLQDNKFIIVNFLRTNLQQVGGGHHSILSTYDAQSDRFLILDVARYKYPSNWVKAEDLWHAVNTIDKDANSHRGFIVITP